MEMNELIDLVFHFSLLAERFELLLLNGSQEFSSAGSVNRGWALWPSGQSALCRDFYLVNEFMYFYWDFENSLVSYFYKLMHNWRIVKRVLYVIKNGLW